MDKKETLEKISDNLLNITLCLWLRTALVNQFVLTNLNSKYMYQKFGTCWFISQMLTWEKQWKFKIKKLFDNILEGLWLRTARCKSIRIHKLDYSTVVNMCIHISRWLYIFLLISRRQADWFEFVAEISMNKNHESWKRRKHPSLDPVIQRMFGEKP